MATPPAQTHHKQVGISRKFCPIKIESVINNLTHDKLCRSSAQSAILVFRMASVKVSETQLNIVNKRLQYLILYLLYEDLGSEVMTLFYRL